MTAQQEDSQPDDLTLIPPKYQKGQAIVLQVTPDQATSIPAWAVGPTTSWLGLVTEPAIWDEQQHWYEYTILLFWPVRNRTLIVTEGEISSAWHVCPLD